MWDVQKDVPLYKYCNLVLVRQPPRTSAAHSLTSVDRAILERKCVISMTSRP